MDLAVAFYVSVYSLAALAGGILAWAEYSPSVTMLTAPIAIALLFLNERHRLVRLDGGWVALAGFAAFAYPAMEFFTGDEEFRLLSGAHLMAILQWVLLAYNKTAHQYWWICALSCLQIAVAAVLTNSPIFGIFILIYMFWALWTLSLYTLLLARLRFGRDMKPTGRKATWQWPTLSRGEDRREYDAPSRDANRELQSSGRLRRLTPRVSEFRGTFQCEPHETNLTWRFVMGITGMSTVALLLGLILFLLTPRVWIGAANPFQDDLAGAVGQSRNITGFSENVRLNDFGRILESSAPVMELRLFDDATDMPLALADALGQMGQEEALLRGATLAIYDRGQWIPGVSQSTTKGVPTGPSPMFPQTEPLIRQEIRLEPIGSNTLFALGQPKYVKIRGSDGQVRVQPYTGSIRMATRGGLILPGISYSVWSPKKPGRILGNRHFEGSLPPVYSGFPNDLPILVTETERILAPLKSAGRSKPPTQIQIVQTLLTYLRDSEQFRYSLDRTVIDANIDPIEDFLVHRKQGHCQYFAAALGLMLRVEGIPTCVITGFKGGIENPDRQLIEIQQRHAHAWVEAYIDGNWITLDPTPADAREEAVQAVGDHFRLWHQLTTFGAMLWNDYVINLSLSRQQQDLYGPMQEIMKSIAGQTKESSGVWRGLLAMILQFWFEPEKWFSLTGGIFAFVLMCFFASAFYILRRLVRLIRKLFISSHLANNQNFRVEFHERFLAILRPLGLVPSLFQTQREFAAQVATEWSQHGLPIELQPLAQQVAQAFDQLRFGNLPVAETEQKQLLISLEQLESHFQKPLAKQESSPPA